jgi:mannan endo-1,4-beta-mannosidase
MSLVFLRNNIRSAAAGSRAGKFARGVVFLGLAFALASPGKASGVDTPVTPGASPEVQSLLAYFSDIYGKKILSGQQEGRRGTNDLGFELTYITNTTGKLPALLGLDFTSCTQQSPQRDTEHRVTRTAIDWYAKRGGIVTFCWHWYAPTADPAFYTKDTKFDLVRGVTEGTPENAALLRDLDAIAGELKLLQAARVPVLWRPMHEVNGRWFWWGAAGPDPYKKLWRMMFDRYTHQHGLTNLIWVFSPGAETDLAEWYPGDEYVDMIGQDHYPMDGNDGPAKDVFDELVALGRGNKLVGMSENGPIPDPDKMVGEKAGWLFFTTWGGRILTERNPKEKLIKVFNHPHVLNLNDLPDLKHYRFNPVSEAVKLGFPSPPGDAATGGLRRLPVTVAVQDRQGRTVRKGNYTVTLAMGKNPSKNRLAGTLTASTVNGIATFPDLKMEEPGEGCTFSAKAAGLRAATSPEFRVGPGGGVLREWWSGDAAAQAAGVETVSTKPVGREILGKAFEVPVHTVTNYAARFRGYLLPPVTGAYVFWIANTANSELWLSTGSTPGDAVKIAAVTPQTPYSKWPHINETQSAPINLDAGRRYYIEVRQKQSSGSAQLAVRWRLPNGIEERPIPGFRLAPPDDALSETKSARNRN